ncbi:CoA transferase [Paraburkholderia fynbosensis]|uniref:Acetyl-CoA:oxalate CoA-transferase n=1 Tax=Paraburkholderia fynbosensis TaxID=1200993 RepID=A0A6J5FSS5_9BURK|nr:CoA transferase [Paraburkholderia fynbosensis]CAB3786624.1 Acetyl-CoA:oxalate CoA-transferase [Paraburkholderia fynbosensis]
MSLKLEKRDGVAIVTLDRPPVNALTLALYAEIADLFEGLGKEAGFYVTSAVLAALHHRDTVSGEGQHIDVALLDAQIGAISHMAQNYFASGKQPPRLGTSSEITCPYQAFQCSDGDVMISMGNDSPFPKFAAA